MNEYNKRRFQSEIENLIQKFILLFFFITGTLVVVGPLLLAIFHSIQWLWMYAVYMAAIFIVTMSVTKERDAS